MTARTADLRVGSAITTLARGGTQTGSRDVCVLVAAVRRRVDARGRWDEAAGARAAARRAAPGNLLVIVTAGGYMPHAMLAKRVIPCLDVHDRQVTRGVQFGRAEAGELRNVGDPVALALAYNSQGADELVFFDITASAHARSTMVDVIEAVASQCFMPLTVGGGIRSVQEMRTMLQAGADKVSINSAALADPDLIRQGAEKFGSQCIVVSIDSKSVGDGRWEVFSHGGRNATGRDTVRWAEEAVRLGAGEIVLNSIDADGTRAGYDLEITRRVSQSVGVPVVASGGAGTLDHLVEVLVAGAADAVLAASIFHFGTYTVADVKRHLAAHAIPVRWPLAEPEGSPPQASAAARPV